MQFESIKVSVIVPVYNVEHFIRDCIDSLLNQSLKEIEIILINDNSPDNCGIICDEYAALDKRVLVIHNEENIRQGLSRNKGISIARGEYIGFVDPDDMVDPDYFEKLYATAKRNKSDIVKAEHVIINSDGTRVKQNNLNKKIKKGLKKGLPVFLLFTYEHWSAIFRREIILNSEAKYPDLINGEDVLFLLHATYFSNTLSLITGVHYYYRQHQNSAVAQRTLSYFNSKLRFFELFLKFINSHKMSEHHYKLAFQLGIRSVINRYKEMSETEDDIFRKEYVRTAIRLMCQNQPDKGYLLENLYEGFTNQEKLHRLKRLKIVRIGLAVRKIPSKAKGLLSSSIFKSR